MDAGRYEDFVAPLRDRPRLVCALAWYELGLVGGFMIACELLFVILFQSAPELLWPAVIIFVAGFLLVSVFRRIFDAPRPAEKDGIAPLVEREGKGRSFPSRHVFSAFIIAVLWLRYNLVMGIILLVFAADLACARVLFGVHYPRDVIVGALIGCAAGALIFLF